MSDDVDKVPPEGASAEPLAEPATPSTEDAPPADSKTADSKTAESKSPESKTAESETAESKSPESETAESETAESEAAESEAAERETAEREAAPVDGAVTTKQDGTDPAVVPTAPRITVQISGMTDVGRIREHNEDNLLVADLTARVRDGALFDTTLEIGPEGLLLAVCDGMGGALAGEVASQMAVDVVHAIVQDGATPADEDGFAQKLVAAVQEAGARIYLAAKTNRNQHGMGTTATVAGVSGRKVFIGQVGDSRAYLLRRGRLRQITKDQSLVSKLIEAGQLTEDEAESYEHAHIILQALGTSDAVCVDLSYADLRKGDMLMLCSDGLSGLATHEQIREIMTAGESPKDCAEQLTDCANDGGGHDNITVIIARFDGDLPEPTDDDHIQGYQAHVLSRPLESLVGGRASTSLKVPDLPPPGSDLKNRLSYPPDAPSLPKYDDDDDDAPRSSARPAAASRDPDEPVSLPMQSSPWAPMVIGAIVIGVLLGAWLALRERPEPPPARGAPTVQTPAAPETAVDTAHPVEPTPLPAPAWDDAGAPDAP